MSDNTNLRSNYVDQLHQSAASGEVKAVLEALKVIPDVNATNSRGWTALMFAARNGHSEVITALLKQGADITMTNLVGQNAKDIAEFWQNHDAASVLAKTNEMPQDHSVTRLPVTQRKSNFFCDSPLDRMSQQRNNKEWLESLKTESRTTYVLFTRLQPLAKSNSFAPLYSLVRFTFEKAKPFLSSDATVIFLGVEQSNSDVESSSDGSKAVGWFAVDCGDLPAEAIGSLEDGAVLLPNPFGFFQLSRSEAAIVGQARSLLSWHERYKFCSTCGSGTRIEDAGYKRVCLSEGCASRKGIHNTSYPRTDPSVIMVVMSPDRSKILLGRDKRFPSAMWSCLAGFLEPGESIEEAVRREVHEESGIRVGWVDYHSCQPWPMPNSLMIGCIAQAESTVIKVDKEELEDAKWFSASEVRQMLLNKHPQGLFCPPEQAIAHQIMKYCLNNMCKL